MARAIDVAEYIIASRKTRSIGAMKLQKLVFYAQAWAMAWDRRPLFDASFEAWKNGPVCPQLYVAHRRDHDVATVNGDPSVLSQEQRETIDAVLDYYAHLSDGELVQLSHREEVWRDARGGLPAGARSNNRLQLTSYFAAAARLTNGEKRIPDELTRGYALLMSIDENDIDDLDDVDDVNAAELSAWLTGATDGTPDANL